MSYVKQSHEIAHIRVSCEITGKIVGQLVRAVKPGITTSFLDDLAQKLCIEHGVKPSFKGYLNYPSAVCISVNDHVVHGLPGDYLLKEGDIVGIDFGVIYNGFFSDMARTVAVGNVDPENQKLLDVTKRALDVGIEQIKPSNRIGDYGHAVQEYVENNGFSVVRELVGHGVGTAVHEPPAVPNHGKPGQGEQFVAGMIIALEPMVNAGSHKVRLMDDGWTFRTLDGKRSAHFEDTVLITERGHEILTRR